jgi:hypothetical protein
MRYAIERMLQLTPISNASHQLRIEFSIITIRIDEFC